MVMFERKGSKNLQHSSLNRDEPQQKSVDISTPQKFPATSLSFREIGHESHVVYDRNATRSCPIDVTSMFGALVTLLAGTFHLPTWPIIGIIPFVFDL